MPDSQYQPTKAAKQAAAPGFRNPRAAALLSLHSSLPLRQVLPIILEAPAHRERRIHPLHFSSTSAASGPASSSDRFCLICSSLLTPDRMLTTEAGCMHQRIASSSSVMPASAAMAESVSTAAKFSSDQSGRSTFCCWQSGCFRRGRPPCACRSTGRRQWGYTPSCQCGVSRCRASTRPTPR